MAAVVVMTSLAGVFWFMLFSPWTKAFVPFWPAMSASTAVLAVTAIVLDRKTLSDVYAFKTSHLFVGIVSAAVLYAFFFAGNFAAELLLPFADSQIENIYSTKSQASPLTISLLLFFWIGPAEEIFWRGFLQRRLAERSGELIGFLIAAALYTLVHIFSFNLMLILASALCGLFWGFIFKYFRSLWPAMISHALWDLVIFVLLPVH